MLTFENNNFVVNIDDNNDSRPLAVQLTNTETKEVWTGSLKPVINNPYKMYFLVLDSIDLGHAILAVGHGAAAAILKFIDAERDEAAVAWWTTSFRKVVCKVTREEFDKAKTYGLDYIEMTESALDYGPTVLVFKPRTEWPTFFKCLPLYK